MPSARRIGILLSGGLDSCILLGKLLGEGCEVQPFFVRGGLAWEPAELGAVQRYLDSLATLGLPGRLRPLTTFDLPLADLYGDHWSVTGLEVPGYDTPDEAVFLPGRNPLLLIKPALWCQMHGFEALALAPLASNPFGDASDAFFESFERSLRLAMDRPLQILRPFLQLTKTAVMRLGAQLPLQFTHSCIAPVTVAADRYQHCGRCNKCAERQAAFRDAGMDDPTDYAP
ncbi:MAG: 7-cyano-7-deazaguanine synthase [Pirellulales bacterium]